MKTAACPPQTTPACRAAADTEPVMAFAFALGSVGGKAVQRQVIVAYDEIFAIEYFGKNFLPTGPTTA